MKVGGNVSISQCPDPFIEQTKSQNSFRARLPMGGGLEGRYPRPAPLWPEPEFAKICDNSHLDSQAKIHRQSTLNSRDNFINYLPYCHILFTVSSRRRHKCLSTFIYMLQGDSYIILCPVLMSNVHLKKKNCHDILDYLKNIQGVPKELDFHKWSNFLEHCVAVKCGNDAQTLWVRFRESCTTSTSDMTLKFLIKIDRSHPVFCFSN